MSVDLAVVGSPFLDLTFEGLPRVPAPGEEVTGVRLHAGPGGTGIHAVGAARLGLSVALVAPVPQDELGRLLRRMLEEEDVAWSGGETSTAHVTALLSTPEGTAMASALPPDEPTAEEVAAVAPTAVVVSLGRVTLAPAGVRVHAVTGPLEAERAAGMLGGHGDLLDSFICNASEAAAITGWDDPAAAALELGRFARTAVVTMGGDGAVGSESGDLIRAAAPDVGLVDATGAGDLFVAAYAWADAQRLPIEQRLAWATLYAGLSVRAPTALAGALHLRDILDEGARRGLAVPPEISRP